MATKKTLKRLLIADNDTGKALLEALYKNIDVQILAVTTLFSVTIPFRDSYVFYLETVTA
jgi:hypothetical protein